jgi:hypothetical protein
VAVAVAAAAAAGDDEDRQQRQQQDALHMHLIAASAGGCGPVGGGPVWLSENEGARIREATAALKNPIQRAGSSSLGGEGCSKRVRRAAGMSDDNVDGEGPISSLCVRVVLILSDTENRLSWRRKTRGLPPPPPVARLGPRHSHNVDANFAVVGESHAPEGCGSSSSIRNEQGSSGKVAEKVEPPLKCMLNMFSVFIFLGGPYAGMRFSTFRRVASASEAVAPPSGGDAEATTGLAPEQPPGDQVETEEQSIASLLEQEADPDVCAEVNMDTAHEVAARGDVGDSPVLDGRDPLYLSGTQASAMHGSGRLPD